MSKKKQASTETEEQIVSELPEVGEAQTVEAAEAGAEEDSAIAKEATKGNGKRKNKRQSKAQQEDVEQDDNFGNSVDYVPQGGIAGIYREPMQGGTNWGKGRNNRHHNRHRNHHRHSQRTQQHEQEGVLSIRQPGWKERIQHSEGSHEQLQSGVLTIRQQGNLARSLRWQQQQQQTYISKPNSNEGRGSWRDGNDGNGRRSNRKQRSRHSQRGKR